MKIKVFYDNVNFRLKESKRIRKLIEKVIRQEEKSSDDLIFIFTSDNEIKKINMEFLNHNYYTDVIAFSYSDGREIAGEVYISIDAVRYNANNYKVSLKSEVLRVMIHGTLHLCGYNDNNRKRKNIMKRIEDRWMEEYIKG